MKKEQELKVQGVSRNVARMLNATAAMVQNGLAPNDGVVMNRLSVAATALQLLEKAVLVTTSEKDRKASLDQLETLGRMIWQMSEQTYAGPPTTPREKALRVLRDITGELVANAEDVQHYDEAWDLDDVAFTLERIAEDAEEAAETIRTADCTEQGLAEAYDAEVASAAERQARREAVLAASAKQTKSRGGRKARTKKQTKAHA